jgi:hypothetical protein
MKQENYELHKEGDLWVTEIPEKSGQFFGFKKWSWGEKNTLLDDCTVVNPMNGMASVDTTKFNEGLIVKTVFKNVDGKFVPFTIEEVRTLDAQLGERLFRITQNMNLVSEIESRNL